MNQDALLAISDAHKDKKFQAVISLGIERYCAKNAQVKAMNVYLEGFQERFPLCRKENLTLSGRSSGNDSSFSTI